MEKDIILDMNPQPPQPHNGKNIDRIVVSEDESFAITYSKEDDTVVGWLINVKENKLQQYGAHSSPKLDIPQDFADDIRFVLHIKDDKDDKTYYLLLYYPYDYYTCLINLSDNEYNFTKRLQHAETIHALSNRFEMGFLSNGDLIIASSIWQLMDYKILLYPSINLWTSSPQLYNIKLPTSSKRNFDYDDELKYYICQTKLFIFNEGLLTQWGFSSKEMTYEKRYNLDTTSASTLNNIMINNNKTLLASCIIMEDDIEFKFNIDVYDMKTEEHISRCVSYNYTPVKFITLKEGSEGLMTKRISTDNKKYRKFSKKSLKVLNPYDPSDVVEIDEFIDDPNDIILTKFEKKLHIKDNNVEIEDLFSNVDKFQQLQNNTYDSTILKTIRGTIEEIIKLIENDEYENDENDENEITAFDVKKTTRGGENEVKVKGFTRDSSSDKWKETNKCFATGMLISYKKVISNQTLVLITTFGIYVYTIVEDFLRLRYLWNNDVWKGYYYDHFDEDDDLDEYKEIIKEILNNEFKNSLPPPNFENFCYNSEYCDLISGIMIDPKNSLKFTSKLLDIEFGKEKEFEIVKLIIDGIIKLIEKEILHQPSAELNEEGQELIEEGQELIGSQMTAADSVKDQMLIEKDPKLKLIQKVHTKVQGLIDKDQILIGEIQELIEEDQSSAKLIDKQLPEFKDDIGQYMGLLRIISLKLPNLCDHHYSSLVMKYISRTSILLDPSCSSIKNSYNTSLHAYSKQTYIKKTYHYGFMVILNLFLRLYKVFNLRKQEKDLVPTISFIVPFPQIWKYHPHEDENSQENEYWKYWKEIIHKPTSPWNEILYKPKSILFCNIDSNDFYQWWNFAAIIDFKWKTFGRIYYFLIWIFYTIFLLCFVLATTLDFSDFNRKILFVVSILLSFIHLSFEFRQFLWMPKTYITDLWNLFEIGAYALPITVSIFWLNDGDPSLQITSITILLLIFKFLLFFRVFPSYGKYFAIIIGVAKDVFPFLVVLFFIVFGFGLAFFVLLRPTQDFSLDHPTNNDDKNNPWNLATKYSSVNPDDGSISYNSTLLQTPDLNSNMFSLFPTSLLAMYLFLTGDSGSLSPWTYNDNSMLTFLIFLFSFFTVIYLMNLFIGLLNMAIEGYNKHEESLLLKAKIIMEIELYYMLPYQRRKKEWFPNWIYYDMHVDKVRDLINAIDNKKTVFNIPPIISKKLRDLLDIPEPIDKHKQTEELAKQIEDIRKLLDEVNNNKNNTKDFKNQ